MARLPSFVFLALFLLFSPASFAQKTATVAGNVYFGSEYNPAKSVTVTLYDQEHNLIESQTTSDAGQFRFGGLRRSTYTVDIDVTGYEHFSEDVDVSMTSDKGLAVYLKPLAKKNDSTLTKTVSVHELSMPSAARDLVDSGRKKLYQEKDAQSAILDFQQALTLAPTYYEAQYQLAMAQMTLGWRADAESSFRKCLELSDNKYPEALVGLGGVLLDRGDVIEAEKFIRQGLQLSPNLWLGHYELGRALMMEKHLPDALTSAEQARTLAPSVPIVYRLLSNIHLAQKDYPALLSDLDTYISLDPDSAAGLRAKQLRDQLQQSNPVQKQPIPAAANP
jgi:tetratricopeptide (TPR) repeat protein